MRGLVERDVIVDNLLDVVEDHRLRLRVLEENIQGVEQGVAGPHNLFSVTHGDAVTAAASRGALAHGNSTPEWAPLAIGAAGTILRSDGTDVAWATVLGIGSLTDPDDDRILFWDDGAGAMGWLDPGSGPVISGTTLNVDHDACTNFVGDEHVAHSGVSITAGAGLTGGGTIAATRTIDVGAGTGIAVNANDVQLSHLGIESLTDPNDDRILFWDDGAGAAAWLDPGSGPVISGTTLNVDHDACTNFVGDEHVAHSGVSITAGAGLTGGGTIAATRTIDVGAGTGIAVNANDVQLSHLGIESLTDPNDDRILFWDDGAGAAAWLDPGSGPVISGTTLNVDHDACTNFVGDEHVAHSGVSITAGAGLTGGGTIAATRTLAADWAEVGDLAEVGAANAAGTGTEIPRNDHVHGHGNQAGGALHAAATTSVAGFLSSADKTKLDGLVGGKSSEGARVYGADPPVMSVSSGVTVSVGYDTERWDDNNYWSATNDTRLTVPEDGWYFITGHIRWEVNASGTRRILIRYNGTLIIAVTQGPASAELQSVATAYYMSDGDYVELRVRQTSGVGLTILQSPARSPEFAIVRL